MPPQQPPGNGMALASLVLGIVGVVGGLIPLLFIVGWGCGAVGVVLGGIGLHRAVDLGASGRGQAIAGMILSGLALVLGTVGFILLLDILSV
jgi:hypothetical protein